MAQRAEECRASIHSTFIKMLFDEELALKFLDSIGMITDPRCDKCCSFCTFEYF